MIVNVTTTRRMLINHMVSPDTRPYVMWRDNPRYNTTTFHDGRKQTDQPCPRSGCGGIARVEPQYAPDVGRNWMKCDYCEYRYV